MMLTQLADVARRTGYPVVEVAGWKTRGRPGGMLQVQTVTCHHTANGGAKGNYPSLRVVRDGRKGLPGPLAQYGLGVDGTIYVIAAGRCNHAGVSRSNAYINSHAIGIEAEAIGVPGAKGDWPPAQMDSYHRLCRALVDEFGSVEVKDVRGHKETCAPEGRKSDPSFDMAAFRAMVSRTDLTLEAAMAELDNAELKKIAEAVRDVPIRNKQADGTEGKPSSIGGSITAIEVRTEQLRREVDANNDARTQQIAAVKLQQDRVEAAVAENAAVLATILERLPAPPAPGQ
jgi:hypothetical protein